MRLIRQMRAAPVPGKKVTSIVRDERGVSMIEFTFMFPILILLSFGATETANYIATGMTMSQTAITIADNAGRIGLRGGVNSNRITEADINLVFETAAKQTGATNIYKHGRVILSSLQMNTEDGQWIAWQRCLGTKDFASAYGVEGTGKTGTSFPGMGPTNALVKSPKETAVMFVELSYDYQPLFSFLKSDYLTIPLSYRAVFPVRDDRDLSRVYTSDGVPTANCAVKSEKPTPVVAT